MMKRMKLTAAFSMAFFAVSIAQTETTHAQLVPTYFPSAVEVVAAHSRPFSCCKPNHRSVAVQVGYPAYFAPQVPVIPMSAVPVPTMSAYYVPTVPVVSNFMAPSNSARRSRAYAVPMLPAVIYPVYGY